MSDWWWREDSNLPTYGLSGRYSTAELRHQKAAALSPPPQAAIIPLPVFPTTAKAAPKFTAAAAVRAAVTGVAFSEVIVIVPLLWQTLVGGVGSAPTTSGL